LKYHTFGHLPGSKNPAASSERHCFDVGIVKPQRKTQHPVQEILWMEEILHHLGLLKHVETPKKQWDVYPIINW